MIVLFGATGFTGELTARALARRGVPALLAARSGDRVAALAHELGMAHARADAGDPASLRALLGPGDVLVSTVGPFARVGDAAVQAAIARGAHYLDSTGEAAFLRRVFARDGPAAARAGCALLPAFGFDFVPGNLAGGLALRQAGGRAARLDVGYFASGGAGPAMSGGTRASGAGMLLDRAHARRGGRLVAERFAARARRFEVDGRTREGVSLGGTEALALPRLAPGLQDVATYLGGLDGARGVRAMSLAASAVARLPGGRAAAGAALRRVAPGSTGGPGAAARAARTTHVVAEARDGAGSLLARVDLAGPDPYDLTAGLLAWGAERIAATAACAVPAGALGPVDAFGLDALQAGCASVGLTHQPSG